MNDVSQKELLTEREGQLDSRDKIAAEVGRLICRADFLRSLCSLTDYEAREKARLLGVFDADCMPVGISFKYLTDESLARS